MKRQGYIFERIICPLNLKRAIHLAARGKRKNRRVAYILKHEEETVEAVRNILVSGYVPTPYQVETIYDGAVQKERTIEKPRFFPDQIIHWALILQIEPLIMRGMYAWNCGSVPGRGQSRCKQGVERWLRGDPEGTKYCLKIDFRKFYQSIDHSVMKARFRTIIKDERTLAIIDAIIDSTGGLNIGNYTSQWFANFYLQAFDHFVKEHLRHTTRQTRNGTKKTDCVTYYARYIDDSVMFARNKKLLRYARDAIFAFVTSELKLKIKENWQIFPVTYTKRRRDGTSYQAGRDVDFLGYRMNHERTTLRRRLSLRISRRARKIYHKAKPTLNDCQAMVSYMGFIQHSDSRNYYVKRIAPYVNIKTMKGMISHEARNEQQHAAPLPGRA